MQATQHAAGPDRDRVALLGGGVLITITGEGATGGTDPTGLGIGCGVFGLLLTVLGIVALFRVNRAR